MALRNGLTTIDERVIGPALSRALDEAQQSIRFNYTAAVTSPVKTAQFAPTLLACALAEMECGEI